jgi:hypothetical protein
MRSRNDLKFRLAFGIVVHACEEVSNRGFGFGRPHQLLLFHQFRDVTDRSFAVDQ